jgi:hypothetical protein
VIPNITRGGNMAELLHYLYGPGKADEHDKPRIVASSQHEATLAKLLGEAVAKNEINAHIKQRTDYLEESRRLYEKSVNRWLNDNGEVVAAPKNGQVTRRGVSRRAAHVWHCSLSLAPGERLTDEQWGQIVKRYAQLMGFNGADEFRATLTEHAELEEPLTNLKGWEARKDRMNYSDVRWDAVHHGVNAEGLDHIHIAAEVVSENGNVWEDVYDERRAQIAAGIIEREFGLQLVDGHQHDRGQQGYKKGELEHDKRMGRDVGEWAETLTGAGYIDKTTARPEKGAKRLLERTVRACAVAAGDELDFVRRLRHEGIEVQGVTYDRGRGRGRITGYKVRLSGSDSERWHGGGHIAKDLTLPALRAAGNWPKLDGDQAAAWTDAATRTLTAPEYAAVVEAETALAELRQRLTEVDVGDRVTWAHVARDAAGMLNAISLRTEPAPGRLADAAYAVAASATINRTMGDRRRWLGRAASRSAARALMAQRPAATSRELLQQVSYMVNQMTEMHMLAAQEQRARSIELNAYNTLETWLLEHPPVLAPADHGWVDDQRGAGWDLDR